MLVGAISGGVLRLPFRILGYTLHIAAYTADDRWGGCAFSISCTDLALKVGVNLT